MEPRRVVAISGDKALRRRLNIGLLAAGAVVELKPGLEALGKGRIDADLVVLHTDQPGAVKKVAKRLGKTSRLVLLLPESDLEAVVASMQASDRVAAVLVADDLDPHVLTAAATRALHGDLFGLGKFVPWGTRVHSMQVGSYQEKSACIAALSEFAQIMGVRRKYREAIEQCADEMLMNALYDAPVDDKGKPLFADVPIKERLEVELERKAVVEYAADETTFYLSVRDHYGTLDRATVLRYLDKCLHAEEQIDRKTGGAGLGLYLMASSTTTFLYNVQPGIATECVVTFDLQAPKVQVKNVAFHTERDEGDAKPAPPSPPPSRQSPMLVAALSVAVVVLLGVTGLLAYPRFIARTGALRITSDPPGARILVDGTPRGTTASGPVLVRELAADEAHRIEAQLDGHHTAQRLARPEAGDVTALALTLEPVAGSLKLTSDPPGAAVVSGGRELGTTPLAVTGLPAGEELELTFRKRGFRPETRRVRVPEGGGNADVSAELELAADRASVTLETEPPGARVYQDGELVVGAQTPVAEHVVTAGREHVFQFEAPGRMPGRAAVTPEAGARRVPVSVALVPGGTLSVSASVPARLTVRGVKECRNLPLPARCPLPDGQYTVVLTGDSPPLREAIDVEIAGADVAREVAFGEVIAPEGYQVLVSADRAAPRAAFASGQRTVALVDAAGVRHPVEIEVPAGGQVTVPAP